MTTTNAQAFDANPFAKKLSEAENNSSNCVTAIGVICKGLVFAAAIALGVFLAFYLHTIPSETFISDDGITVNKLEGFAVIGAFALFIIAPIIAFLIRITTPVAGALFCASVGYTYAFMANLFDEYKGIILFAMIITIALFAAITLTYMSGLIKVGNKFKSVFSITFTTLIIASLATSICSFVPALNSVTAFIATNPVLNIAISILGVLVAVMFMINSLDTARKAIDNKVDKKYEWTITFSIIFAVIWLFLEIVSLIVNITDSSK